MVVQRFYRMDQCNKSKTSFEGHDQPIYPADLGYYDLRVPEIREQQAQMAKDYGLYGFIYYHYWFGKKKLMETIANDVLTSGKPDFPFCFCWQMKPGPVCGKSYGKDSGRAILSE